MSKRILIIGGVAGGATAAARARRMDEQAEITVLERGPYVSFANCGLPYFISGDIKKRSALLLQTAEGFWSRYRVKVLVNTEALEINRTDKSVRVLTPEGESSIPYDSLILAQGGNPILPALPGSDALHTFKLWTVPDMDRINTYINEKKPQTAVVAGGGFIGLEMAEAFHARGIKTTVVELAPRILTVLDQDMSAQAKETLIAAGIEVITGTGLAEVHGNPESAPGTRKVLLSDGRSLEADLVLFSVGVRPELTLAKKAGLSIGAAGGLVVDQEMRTSDPAIWAAGDMVEVLHKVSGKMVRIPLAGPANRQGRIAADNALGAHQIYRGALGTSVVKILDHTAASTGLTEAAARDAGFDFAVAIVHKDHHAGYFPGAKMLSLKLVYDKKDGRLLGAQAYGMEGVEKRIDVLATALHGRMTLDDLAELDLAYAPPYSSANDPLNMAAFVGQNHRSGFSPVVSPSEFKAIMKTAKADDFLVLDVRNLGEYAGGHLEGALNIPVDELRDRLGEVNRNKTIYVHCKVGFRGHLALRILKEHGYDQVWNITGGYLSLLAEGGFTLAN